MIIRNTGNRSKDIQILEVLVSRPDASEETKRKIEQEIRNVKAGMKGERESAYEIDFHFGASKNWMIIHDLRLECDGRVAQIDHLLINRFMEIWVCESKNFAEGISVNEQGECTAFYGGKPRGVPSPFEQNRKHIEVLKSLFDIEVALPKRLGFEIKPTFNSIVLVSKNARISRPKKFDDIIIKNDQIKTTIQKNIDEDNNLLGIAKILGSDTLQDFATRLASAHRPIEFNWAAKFGLPEVPPQERAPQKAAQEAEEDKPKGKLICRTCGEAVTYAVAKFCWVNKPRFGGNVYCISCQKSI